MSSRVAAATSSVLIFGIGCYQARRLGRPSPCRFVPSCSEYAIESIRSNGPVRGSLRAIKRILRCNPLGGRGFDPASN